MSDFPSFLVNVGSTQDSRSKKQKVLVYGQEGTGKTLFAASWPNVLLFAFEEGVKTLQVRGKELPVLRFDRMDVKYGNIRIYTELMHTLDLYKMKEGPFAPDGPLGHIETLAFDGFTTLSELLMLEIMAVEGMKDPNTEKADWDDYGKLKNRFQSIISFLQDMDTFFVGTAHLAWKETSEGAGLKPMPDAVGSTRESLRYAFDELYYFHGTEVGGKNKYEVHTKLWRGYPAKTRSNIDAVLEWEGEPTYLQLYGDPKDYR
jgi:hypothetical protein